MGDAQWPANTIKRSNNKRGTLGMAVIYAFIKGTLNNVQSKLFARKKYSNHRRNRHYFSANGPFLLLPLALKWSLLSLLVMVIVPCVMAKGAYATSLTVEVPQNPLSVTVSADGTAKESSQANVKVTSDAYWGYTFSMKSGSDDGSLVSSSNRLPVTNTEKATLDNNTWGFKVSGGNVSSNVSFHKTTKSGTQLDKTNGKVGEKEENIYSFILGANVDNTQPAGTYTGQFTFTLTANTVDYTINYDGNGGSGEPATATGKSIEETIQISDTTPSKESYGFAGWCTREPLEENCNGEVYQPGDVYALSNSINAIDLYAIWAETNQMQDWSGCSGLKQNQITYLKDVRDDNTYKVAKLKDGKCWMVENLRLGGDEPITLTSENSDVSTNFELPGSNMKGFEFRHEYNQADIYIDPGTKEGHEDFGGYYTWYAATAGTGTSELSHGENAASSICPKGWGLPTGGPSGEFTTLAQEYGIDATKWLKKPVPGYVLSGSYGGGQYRPEVEQQTNNLNENASYWWTSTMEGPQENKYVYASLLQIVRSTEDSKYKVVANRPWAVHRGMNIRCVARKE